MPVGILGRVRFKAVLFDFHGTLAQVEEPTDAVLAAAAACGHTVDAATAGELAEAVVASGRAGGPFPTRVPPELAELWQTRDLSQRAHRAVYTGLAAAAGLGLDGMPEALYERLLVPEGWRCYADTVAVLRALRRGGVPVAVVSNIGFDVRPVARGLGWADLVDAWALSYEVGACKPDAAIFEAACAALGVAPADALMVGDTVADAGAVLAGCTCLVLPVRPAGADNGLSLALNVTGVTLGPE
jgi:HAD superfamily hydrolase (TIGR01509 family)